ncbi:MAG: zinc ribbon domain-containing protein [Desulfohalobiaceae bacterium]|nr:zinc ribbon domain-containing protein [Desulfohalobiaceae bacterium]
MPIYEFYCPDCHTIYSFLSLKVDTGKRPDCPQCRRPELSRQVSLFSISRGLTEDDDTSGLPDLDESKMEQAMRMMEQEADRLDGDDPGQAARFMKKLCDSAGLKMGPGMEEAMRRLEAGQDPEQVEAELGDVLENEDPFFASGKGSLSRLRPPAKDETIYDL